LDELGYFICHPQEREWGESTIFSEKVLYFRKSLLLSLFGLLGQRRAEPGGVIGMHLLEVPQLAIDNELRHHLHRLGDVGIEAAFLALAGIISLFVFMQVSPLVVASE
jgi:hypothetical protein